MATIVLKYPATCTECGVNLEAGDKARYYGRNGIYGIGCHEFKPKFKTFVEMSHPEQRKERFSTPCGHEDYPCCGCRDEMMADAYYYGEG